MQVKDDDDLYKGQRLTHVKCDKQCPIDLHWPEESLSKLKMMMTFLKVKGQQRVKCGKLCSMAAIFGPHEQLKQG